MKLRTKRGTFGVGLLAGAAVLCAAGVVFASSGEGGSLSHEKVMDLIWRAMNFAALVVILVKFGAKPIGNMLGSRRQAIANQFENLDERRSDVEQTYKQYEAKLGHIDQEVKTILEKARVQAENEKEKIIADAERTAADIKRKAEVSVQHELAEAKKELRTEVAEKAALMAESLIKKNLQEADQNKLVDDYLQKVGALG